MDKETLHRYIANATSASENEAVLKYFTTPEGKAQLKILMDEVAHEQVTSERMDAGISDRIYRRVTESIATTKRTKEAPVILWYQNAFLRVAASLLLLLVLSALVYSTRNEIYNRLFPIAYVEVESPAGYKTEVILGDGTVVKLNEKAKIKYPKDFSRTANREIALQGEAYFDVKRNPNKPFIITTHKSQIQVLGTSFNVKEKVNDSSVMVAVTHGLVAVHGRQKNKQVLKLKAGDIGTINDSTIILRKTGRIHNYLAWSSGKITFYETPLSEVVEELNLIYGTHLILESAALKKLTLTASLKYRPLPYVVKEICTFMGLQYQEQDGGNVYTISGKGNK